jgi:cell wall-associated NlpC family hydrolase
MKREQVIAATRDWLGTPYHHMARKKGQGVDCGQLIIAGFVDAGAVEDFKTGYYTPDWHLHRGEEKYLGFIEAHLARVDDDDRSIDARLANDASWHAPAGDVIVFRVGRTFSHGGIVSSWPMFIHSYLPSGIVEEVDIRNTPMSRRPARVYTFEGYER